MLDEYMQAHPDEVFVLEQENDFNESSDDYDFSVDEVLDTPRGESDESFKEPLKSNTSLGHSGNNSLKCFTHACTCMHMYMCEKLGG